MTNFSLSNYKITENIYLTNLNKFRSVGRLLSFNDIKNGKIIAKYDDEVDTYLALYQAHHACKLDHDLNSINWSWLLNENVSLFDWGSGPAVASLFFLEKMINHGFKVEVKNITLIEPSLVALERGVNYLRSNGELLHLDDVNIETIHSTFNDIDDFPIEKNGLNIHFFSNVMDIHTFDLTKFSFNISKCCSGKNLFICNGPNYSSSIWRINDFFQHLSKASNANNISELKYIDQVYAYHLISDRMRWINVKGYHKIFYIQN
ncbi:MAG: hypothetical protein K8F36_13475 [Melioribacteraceae bacterium]|nr:hypothetical protein [Melioribacteraceae bacterium]